MTKKKKVYFGWWVATACFLLMAFTFPPMYTMVGQAVVPMAEEFDVSRTVSGLVIIAGFAGVAIGSPIAGRAHHRYSARYVVAVALVGIAVCCVGIFFAPGIELVIILSFARGIVFSFVGIVTVSIMVNAWFGKKMRGRVQALTMM